MADEKPKVTGSEAFGILGSAASGIGAALAGSEASESTDTTIVPTMDFASVALGGLAGGGAAYAFKQPPLAGALVGAALAWLVGGM